MKVQYYALYDKVATRFMSPIPFASEAEAVRSFKALCENPEPGKFVEDYEFFKIFEYDDVIGEATKNSPVRIASYLSVIGGEQ